MNRRCTYLSRCSPLTRMPVDKVKKTRTLCEANTLGSAFSPLQTKADIGQIIDVLLYETESALATTIKFTVFTPILGALEFSVKNGAQGIHIWLRRASQMTANVMRNQQYQITESMSQQLGKPVNFDIGVHLM